MTKEQEEAIERLKEDVKYSDLADTLDEDCTICFVEDVEIVLNLIQEQQEDNEEKDKIIKSIKNYANQEIICCTESINDYIDDDKKGNQNIINDLREDREHWKDIIKIMNNQETYMNWKEYDENQAKM